ncbi:alpha/beta hydrolase family protein [Phaeocystidibacter luteus]|uniref:S9 family peptidase n=1 Tax=Phaeocystidibacter luteus TaxID=911197 RepID=A0A6N6RL61_9FLAO|nr:prolyl oligopeptidase family serine peptidase [Phaeocystidibacter luteus]KAB2813732.1 S9 family peptidase [Phaeocystidibacter luteus]
MRKHLLTLTLLLPLFSLAQQRALTHDDYDGWKAITNYTYTHFGDHIAVETSPQRGDSHVELFRVRGGRVVATLERASSPSFTADGKWLFVNVSPPYAEVRALKLKDTKKEDMPKDHLVRVNVRNGEMDTLFNVASFKVHSNHGAVIAITLEDEPEVEEEEEADSTEVEVETDFIVDGDDEHGSGYFSKTAKRLVVWNLETNKRDTIDRVTTFKWAEDVDIIAGVRSAGDSTQPSEFFTANAATVGNSQGWMSVIDTAFEDISQFTLNSTGSKIAWLRTSDSADADVRYYELRTSDGAKMGATIIATDDTQMPGGWMLSPHSSLNYSKDSKSLYLATMPVPFVPEEDTTVLDEERVKLDIWSWNDEEIQPMQKVNADSDKKQSYTARLNLANSKLFQLETEELENVSVDADETVMYAVGYQVPHAERASLSWNYPTRRDFYLVNVMTGGRELVARGVRSWPSLSPDEKYVYWWDGSAKNWMAYRVADGQEIILNANIPTPMWNEDHDTPNDPGSYGMAGWMEDDEAVVLYDRFDMWKVMPGGDAVNLTKGIGRQNETSIRYQRLDRENRFLSTGDWIVSTFDDRDKSTSYTEFRWKEGKFEELVGGDYRLSSLQKADSADIYFYRKETISQYPEIYAVRGDDLADAKKLTSTNPQQSEYRWGTSELVKWTSPRGIELEGLLLKPEDFNPNKKYPVLVYFYETYSDLLHNYWNPRPSASTINFPYFLSNEYVIFIPDIVYQEGYPGRSAEECIISGAEMIAEFPWADASKMAIQGQSWGGYQVAHLVTRTDMFACAMAGAPVSNMTSAYGGIRWGSGMSREFQYERTQSRIGGTLWERKDLYLENSPVFYADQVSTPLLIMHNDGDGAVPWYQGIEYFMALRRLQKPVWMLVYNGEEHNLMQRHNRMDLSVRMGQFFDHYLKGEAAPEWMVKGRPYLEKEYNEATELITE